VIIFSNTSKECFATSKIGNLADNILSITVCLAVRITSTPNVLIVTHSQCRLRHTRNVAKTSELNTFKSKIFFIDTSLLFLLHSQVVEKCCTVLTATYQTHVVIRPVDATDLAVMSF
jgi:hypothetical protein